MASSRVCDHCRAGAANPYVANELHGPAPGHGPLARTPELRRALSSARVTLLTSTNVLPPSASVTIKSQRVLTLLFLRTGFLAADSRGASDDTASAAPPRRFLAAGDFSESPLCNATRAHTVLGDHGGTLW